MRNITSVLTNHGQSMLSNINGKKITFTKAVVGQSISPYPLEQCSDVTSYLKDVTIEKTATVDNRFVLYLKLNNRDVLNDTYVHQIGIYAKVNDGTEKLVQIIEGKVGDFIPNQTELFEKEYEVSIKFETSFADATININYSNGGGSVVIPDVSWDNILDKPSTFPPSTHSHTVTWDSITEKPSTYPPSVHKHSIDDINFNEISQAQINSLF